MSKNAGILYTLRNELWGTNLKCGLTTQKIEKRISNLQTHPRNKIIYYFISGAHQKFN